MMTIIHGDNIFASREELNKFKNLKDQKEVIYFEGNKLTLTDIIESAESQSFFGGDKRIIIENILSLKSKDKKRDEIITYLTKFPEENDCVIWENKELTKTILSKFPKAKILLFKLEKQLFRFLDSIKPNNGNVTLPLFHTVLKSDAPELIFFMMVRQFRHMILLKNKSTFLDGISPWQEQKIRGQASNFTHEQLIKLYNSLEEIDYSIKSGKSAMDLTGRLDMFLVTL
jgi:DNA polymerase III delta subunit